MAAAITRPVCEQLARHVTVHSLLLEFNRIFQSWTAWLAAIAIGTKRNPVFILEVAAVRQYALALSSSITPTSNRSPVVAPRNLDLLYVERQCRPVPPN